MRARWNMLAKGAFPIYDVSGCAAPYSVGAHSTAATSEDGLSMQWEVKSSGSNQKLP